MPLLCRSIRSALIATLICTALSSRPAHARLVAVDIDLPLDTIASGQPFKVGDHHRARVIYDDARVDPRTHIVRPLHMQHLLGPRGWVPASPDPVAMPMSDAWLDLGHKPWRYHYRSAVIEQGEPVLVDFDAATARMSIRRQSDGAIVVAAPMKIEMKPVTDLDLAALSAPPPARAITMHDVAVRLDQVAAGERSRVGDVDRMRVVYDARQIDPATATVPLLNLQHFIMGRYTPEAPDAQFMPVGNAWLELGSQPYRLHFGAAVVHGKPIIINADERARRLTIRDGASPGTVLIGGAYEIDPRPITGPDAEAAAGVAR